MKQTEERHSESRMRAIRTSGSMRGSPRRSLAFAPLTPSGSPYSTNSDPFDFIYPTRSHWIS